MDKKFLKEHNLLEVQKRFQQICEYTYYEATDLLEDDGDENEIEQPQDGDQNNNEDPQDPNQNIPPQTDTNTQSPLEMEDMPTVEDIPMDGENMDDDLSMDDSIESETMQPGDEVIDIDDLTQSQQSTEIKIDDVDEKLTTLLNVVNKFSDALEQNDQKIMDLKAEIEKRNPTEEEKLNLRSQATYPYNVKPKSFWDDKTKNGNYNVTYDNEISTSQENKDDELVFTKQDLKGINDREISQSFDDFKNLNDFIKF